MRWAVVAAILIGAAVGYLALLHQFRVSEAPEEREFGVGQGGEELVQVYIEPISIDALNHSMRGQVSLVASRALRGRSLTAPDRDLVLVITHGKTGHEFRFPASEPIPVAAFELDLSGGNVAEYPFDTYRADLAVQVFAYALPPAAEAKILPAQVRVWEALLGFHLEPSEQPGRNPREVRLRFEIHRSGAFGLFALAAYSAMVVLACSALTIGILAFTGVRRLDAPFVGALGAIVFALAGTARRAAGRAAARGACGSVGFSVDSRCRRHRARAVCRDLGPRRPSPVRPLICVRCDIRIKTLNLPHLHGSVSSQTALGNASMAAKGKVNACRFPAETGGRCRGGSTDR